MSTSTRYLGLCPACARLIKVRDGLLVHHGYERPGTGEIVGDCFGVGRPPHEVSDETAKAWRAFLKDREHDLQRGLADLPKVKSLWTEKFVNRSVQPVEVRKDEVSEREWEGLYERREHRLQHDLKRVEGELARIQEWIDTWEKKPLRAVEEEKAQKKAAAEDRRRAVEDKRRKKLAEKVEFYRKKRESIVTRLEKARGKLAKAKDWQKEEFKWDVYSLERDLEQLPDDAVRKLVEISNYTLTREDAHGMLGFKGLPGL